MSTSYLPQELSPYHSLISPIDRLDARWSVLKPILITNVSLPSDRVLGFHYLRELTFLELLVLQPKHLGHGDGEQSSQKSSSLQTPKRVLSQLKAALHLESIIHYTFQRYVQGRATAGPGSLLVDYPKSSLLMTHHPVSLK